MIIDVPTDYKANQLLGLVKAAAAGADIQCGIERQYAILKIALVRLQRGDLSLSLLNARGVVTRQITARKRSEGEAEDALSASQVAAVQGLEKAFQRCRSLGLLVVGFSDSLVAVPEELGCGAEVLSSSAALELEVYDAYQGFDDSLD